ncbi:CzcE family metal-binding protein [Massilia suwonensis]|uniref:CzcE family metal-binding protein n=1 Tax=Massilia suwonensis TaxID=648895 RepID=A0ABW0MI07_9BURK
MFYSTKRSVAFFSALTLAQAVFAHDGPHDDIRKIGMSSPVSAATRTVTIAPQTRYINVNQGDIVKFEVEGKVFAWQFDTERPQGWLDLALFAPKGINTYAVQVFVGQNPLYQN